MSRKLLPVSITAALVGGTAMADVPNVAVDIAPVHSLVARVMDGVGTPDLIVPPGASPHEYNLRPSEAAALQEADLVFWLGEDLTPWMEGAVGTLADGATVTALMESDGTVLLNFRESVVFEAHSHSNEDDHGDNNHDVHDDHGHGGHDPHAWLSPENANTWLTLIAAQLSSADPDNAGVYLANAAAAREEIDALSADVAVTLEPVRGGNFIVFHDAYQYFEDAFDFPASGAISIGDASDPSPARIAEIRARIKSEGIDCVLAEPQFNQGIVDTILDGTEANTGMIDPLGSELEPGSALYPQVIRNMAKTLAECL
ncbi:zinc ABC transporter substrate-binding protein [Ruegeria sp. 2012CJ41-6]|uniref:High-affinity zinc uptake system protein ZnuA n=1 Tax=Ruegeria spongiae TaxID=2942209 RepID=A0ABT0Q2Z9_9RHOB|nr:zinc ABC transporter substrate-binding protein [Ruegeria spongiae]MCL6284211.1 zinc ABC transporter substrate-binding protein [Ruegeria spongiae]